MHRNRLLSKLKEGLIDMDFLTGKKKSMSEKKKQPSDEPFVLWKGDEEDELTLRKGPQHVQAPKMKPPGHAESYNPAEEYLPTEEELKAWEDLDEVDRPYGALVPQKFKNLRTVGAYQHSVKERFERCLDLYLAPRMIKKRLNIDPESLVPKLPSPKDLKPFPNAKCIVYSTATSCKSMVRAISVSPSGEYFASGSEDGYVRVWEVMTGKMVREWGLHKFANVEDSATETVVSSVEWNPNSAHHVLLVGVGKAVVVIRTDTGCRADEELTSALLEVGLKGGGKLNPKAEKACAWERAPGGGEEGGGGGPAIVIKLNSLVKSVRFHKRGDYFVTIASPQSGASSVLIHQLSKGTTQQPFSKSKGEAQTACFHPSKPFLFVASQSYIRVYHLVKQSLVKRLVANVRMISSIDVHHSGDHLVVGTLDRRLLWFDLDLGANPYKTLKYHERAIRGAKFHPRYPLMGSCADDGNVHIFHATVYSDLMRNPLVIPVKVLRGAHEITKKIGVLAMEFHPKQPWVFTAGADGKIWLFQDI